LKILTAKDLGVFGIGDSTENSKRPVSHCEIAANRCLLKNGINFFNLPRKSSFKADFRLFWLNTKIFFTYFRKVTLKSNAALLHPCRPATNQIRLERFSYRKSIRYHIQVSGRRIRECLILYN